MAKPNIKHSNHLKDHKMQFETTLPNTKHELNKSHFIECQRLYIQHCELVASTKVIQVNTQPLLHDNPKEINLYKAI